MPYKCMGHSGICYGTKQLKNQKPEKRKSATMKLINLREGQDLEDKVQPCTSTALCFRGPGPVLLSAQHCSAPQECTKPLQPASEYSVPCSAAQDRPGPSHGSFWQTTLATRVGWLQPIFS